MVTMRALEEANEQHRQEQERIQQEAKAEQERLQAEARVEQTLMQDRLEELRKTNEDLHRAEPAKKERWAP
ncbi:hypothetical protein VNO80_27053 [Phaseolus coccineus]|uniref:Uncharacterized protein n=1 Tax=Phaseolus coccineus TaxID=3886 RepID=A0AAN9LGM7_PHACN